MKFPTFALFSFSAALNVAMARVENPTGDCPATKCSASGKMIDQVLLLRKWQLSKLSCENRSEAILECDGIVESTAKCTSDTPNWYLAFIANYWGRKNKIEPLQKAVEERDNCVNLIEAYKAAKKEN